MSEQSQSPENPLTQLAAAAAQIHEMFRALIGAGFTEPQALYLVGQQVRPRGEAA